MLFFTVVVTLALYVLPLAKLLELKDSSKISPFIASLVVKDPVLSTVMPADFSVKNSDDMRIFMSLAGTAVTDELWDRLIVKVIVSPML